MKRMPTCAAPERLGVVIFLAEWNLLDRYGRSLPSSCSHQEGENKSCKNNDSENSPRVLAMMMRISELALEDITRTAFTNGLNNNNIILV